MPVIIDKYKAAIIALLVGVFSPLVFSSIASYPLSLIYSISDSSKASDTEKLVANIVVGVVIFGAVFLASHFYRYLAFWNVYFIASGFKLWAQKNKNIEHEGELWNWVADQAMVSQKRYAFAIGCIAFQCDGNDEKDKVLLIKRPFSDFDEQVYLWPGSRIRGVEDDLSAEVKKIVRIESGCEINILNTQITNNNIGKVESIDGNGEKIENFIHHPPSLLMQQNREQKNGIPGHIDLRYMGEVSNSNNIKRDNAYLIELNVLRGNNFDDKQLWIDTKKVIFLAYDLFKNSHPQTENVPS